ncbi:hypothetical protein JTB14_018220 [Gonioctena quinquepunctata]|nr:hypothetical protein JTB14_018220 [Gonioctena quinquepunctata]
MLKAMRDNAVRIPQLINEKRLQIPHQDVDSYLWTHQQSILIVVILETFLSKVQLAGHQETIFQLRLVLGHRQSGIPDIV